MLTSLSRGAWYGAPWLAAAGGPVCARAMGSTSWTRASDYAEERDHLPSNVYVPEGGRRVSTPDLDPVRHSLMEPDALGGGGRHSLLDPTYHAGSSAKAFAGWDPRSFGNSLGSSLREPPYNLTSASKSAIPPQRRMPRRG